ncbi:glycoside hydrolase family 16 protein [Peniophora sp. CONT]|nr:glycoside hydrolase family 16 protein [Peniophora sp. CONT]
MSQTLRRPAVYSQDDPPSSASNLLTPASGHSNQPHPAYLRRPSSSSSLNSNLPPSVLGGSNKHSSVADKFSLLDGSVFPDQSVQEPDDYLHNPDPRRDKHNDNGGTFFTARGLANLGCLAILACGIITLFGAYPMISHFTKKAEVTSNQVALGLGGVNASGDYPRIPGLRGMIDPDTPDSAKTVTSFNDTSKTLQLIWSDEFNVDGRTFYPGDDPYFEALDIYYWQTQDLEWYDPSAVTTKDGMLEITFTETKTHNVSYQGGMMTSWNQMCFTGGLIEAAVVLPGSPEILGFWPAVWLMGNLGRVGYGATTDGLWPYSYDACDYGALKNQSLNNQPAAIFQEGAGDQYHDGDLSWLSGQRLSRCTCPGESHPGPMHSDKTYVGRGAPELDVFEALATAAGHGNVSQTLQMAPFNYAYEWPTGNGNMDIYDDEVTSQNGYFGGATQQAISGLSITNSSGYELTDKAPVIFGLEYKPGFDNSYITWLNNGKPSWTINSGGLAKDDQAQISARPVPQEPMYMIMNLGMSPGFVIPDFDKLTYPGHMYIDYIRIYQDPDNIQWGCDPEDFPTADYINTYLEAYKNPNTTLWSDIGETFPKNKYLGEC